MADNFSVRAADGSTLVLGAKDLSSVYLPKHILVDASGNIMPSADAIARSLYVRPGDGTNGFLSGAVANIAAQTSLNAMLVTETGQWTVTHAPAVNTQATATRAAGGAGVRHVATALLFGVSAGGAAPTATQLTVHLRDGATGVGTPLVSFTVAVPATAGACVVVPITSLKIVGSANTALCLEFTAGGGANTYEFVTLVGHSCS